MGYIPPVKDEQTAIYGNRQLSSPPMIPTLSPTERIAFFDALKDHSKKGNYFERNEAKQRLLKAAREYENAYTGKGDSVDESV